MRAEEAFLEKVIELHPEAEGKPCVIGNCQAGWAVMMLAAVRPELFGPIIVPGSPLSYWAGVKGQNPMRYTGGLLGGSWLTALMSDLGKGRFDGGYLVENFESMNPSNTYWSKNYNLWSKVDTEAERFLGFERWWGGHVSLNAEEIQWIVDQLFIGNRLATAELTTSDGVRIDLRNIRSPILCFASEGDNITPPQQAIGWIVDCYEDDDDILANEQTIVYSIHKSVGHLGIFVSGGVAKKEHQEFASNIDLIDILPPGIYEAVMVPKQAMATGAELAGGDWVARFERRTLDDVRAIVQPDPEDERRFATVKRVSEINLGLYRTLLQPLVQALANDKSADWLHKLQPAELPLELLSDKNPLMGQVAAARRAGARATGPEHAGQPVRAAPGDDVVDDGVGPGRVAGYEGPEHGADLSGGLRQPHVAGAGGVAGHGRGPAAAPGYGARGDRLHQRAHRRDQGTDRRGRAGGGGDPRLGSTSAWGGRRSTSAASR